MRVDCDSPTKRDMGITAALRGGHSLRDGCVLVTVGISIATVTVYGDTLFEKNLSTGAFKACMPYQKNWCVRKLNACLAGTREGVRAYTTFDGKFRLVDAEGCDHGEIGGVV